MFRDREQTLAAVRAVFSAADSGGFRVYLDDACAMPAAWHEHRSLHASNTTVPNEARAGDLKYAAERFIPNMLLDSPFVTRDWRRSNASIVILHPHRYGGPVLGPERCRRALERRSEAWRATSGRRHFFVLTGDFGPCDHSGHLISPMLLAHHIIATHGERDGHHWHWTEGPDLPCFVSQKDISIPPANWEERPSSIALAERGGASETPRVQAAGSRDLLAFFAGAGEFRSGKRQGRQLMLRFWGKDADPSIKAVPRMKHEEMIAAMSRSKFCPIFGGNSPWSTRLVEAMATGCVPVFFSSWLPPFSRVLGWDRFSVHFPSLDLVPQLKELLEQQPYERLAAALPRALGAMWFRTHGGYQGDDLLPFLLVEMHLALQAAALKPLRVLAEEILGLPLQLSHFEDDVLANRSSPLRMQLPPRASSNVKRAIKAWPEAFRGGVTIVTNRSAVHREQVWRCVPMGKNGHSYRATDPYDFRTGEPGLADASLARMERYDCLYIPRPRTLKAQQLDDPMSPTQVPPNYTLVRGNREYYFPHRPVPK